MEIKQFEFNLFGVNTYIVWDAKSRRAAVIDPGMTSPDEYAVVDSFIADNNLNVARLINTHLHIDHTFGDRHIMNRYGVQLEAHPDDAFLGSRLREQAAMFHLRVAPEPLSIDAILLQGDVITLGDDSLNVLHIPGHSPGSIVLYNATDGFVITGDVLFCGSIGRTDLPGGNHAALIRGIHEKLLTLPPSTVVYPGHGPATTIARELSQFSTIFANRFHTAAAR